MKYTLIKAIDVAGLNFLTPVVLLCYGEEPAKQLREIGRYIVLPLLAVAVAVGVWVLVAERIQTKSGKLPNPAQTWSAASAIWTFHLREEDKADAYLAEGSNRAQMLDETEARLAKLEAAAGIIESKLSSSQADASAAVDAKQSPAEARVAKATAEITRARSRREEALLRLAQKLPAGSPEGKEQLVGYVRAHEAKKQLEREELKALRDQLAAQQAGAKPEVERWTRLQSSVAEEQQYLAKKADLLAGANRAARLDREKAQLTEAEQELLAATGADALAAARRVERAEGRIASVAQSAYAQPATLPFQTKRSVLCVFCGFLLGSAIAIPIGILCGLSKTVMAMATPFIALLKPVSPIVWLPVALIIVSGFIPDPDKNPLVQKLWALPWMGDYKINPAFIASAITVALCSLWATMTNTALGVASVDKDHLNVARVLRLGFWDRLFKIVLPSALPLMFAGLRISLGVGWMVLIAAELLSSSEGIGKFVWDQFNNGASDSFAKMVVVVFEVGVVGLLLDRVMIVFQRLVSFDGAPAAI
ncbi:Bicarbonate transport system permease protein CmpB [Pirellulimonas nuda]|uniref:Bicarbonate transport system permease protein CmpB n=1 Tax=Pirellulimonas nuda TaxID=2528009 RepID=A0A518DG65_9BACT|nr:ABC transporter permease subunit [Pirellulimonas nuda]QDU90449.1 Bicarbonate transport system permease protein CmpB [Pirellulimonas nuda]